MLRNASSSLQPRICLNCSKILILLLSSAKQLSRNSTRRGCFSAMALIAPSVMLSSKQATRAPSFTLYILHSSQWVVSMGRDNCAPQSSSAVLLHVIGHQVEKILVIILRSVVNIIEIGICTFEDTETCVKVLSVRMLLLDFLSCNP